MVIKFRLAHSLPSTIRQCIPAVVEFALYIGFF
jgi:hypothetical protein